MQTIIQELFVIFLLKIIHQTSSGRNQVNGTEVWTNVTEDKIYCLDWAHNPGEAKIRDAH